MVSKKTIKTFIIVIVTAAATAILLSPWLARIGSRILDIPP